jgi:hypothetical protein
VLFDDQLGQVLDADPRPVTVDDAVAVGAEQGEVVECGLATARDA